MNNDGPAFERAIDITRRVRTARKFIYDEGYAVNSKAVDGVLAPESIVPTLVRQISTVKLKSGLVDTFP